MSYSHPLSSEGPGSDYSTLPGVHITIDQLVAMNIRYWRKKARLTQEALAERVGWSAPNVSAAELSANEGKDKRRFDAQALITFADALRVPVAALLLPPEDDGITKRYLFHGADNGCEQMSDLVSLVISDPAEDDDEVTDAYRIRYFAAVTKYADPHRGEQLAARMEGLTTSEERKARLERLAWQREALAATVGDIDQLVDAIADMESEAVRHDGETPAKEGDLVLGDDGAPEAPGPAAGADSAPTLLRGALSPGEQALLEFGLDPELAAELVKAFRARGIDELIARYADRRRTGS